MQNIRSKWIALMILSLPFLAMPLMNCSDATLQACNTDENGIDDCSPATVCFQGFCIDPGDCVAGACNTDADCQGGSGPCSNGCCIEPDSGCEFKACTTTPECSSFGANAICSASGCCIPSN